MDPVLAGSRLSHYRIERLLGAGGMGSVYLARDLSLDRPVAIKFIADDKAADDYARRRLIREARAAAALDHPNICTIHEVVDDPSGPAYIVMQYVEGETLASALRAGPLERREALSLVNDLGSALATAERCGIVHRDIKPQNIIVTNRGAKLLDFGIARVPETAAGGSDAETQSKLTAIGMVPGTLAYMSPEQVLGKPADHRSDLFSLGVVLYECLSGHPPFAGDHPYELANQILNKEPPPISQTRPEISPADDELCRRLLAKNREDRFQSASELLGALRVLTTNPDSLVPDEPVKKRWLRPASIGGGAAGIVVLAGFLSGPWHTPPSAPADAGAARYYRLGIEAIREGLPHSARLALHEVMKAEPGYAPALIRLAEAEIELDDADAAQEALLRLDSLVPNESSLTSDDRTRVRAVRALMLRDVDTAVESYRALAARHPNDPGAWLDVGRALDAAGLRRDARASYEKALQLDDDYAAAHLRRGTILGLEGRLDEALIALSEAERLYKAASNSEGEVESLVRRGIVLNSRGELQEARTALTRARDLAKNVESRAQQVQVDLVMSSVIAAEGRWRDAEAMASDAVDTALRFELESVAAEGLLELSTTLQYQGKYSEASAHLLRAESLATKRGRRSIAARALLQRASVQLDEGRFAEALALAKGLLAYFQEHHFRRLELSALTVMARAHEELGHYAEARELAERCRQAATEIRDEGRVAEALENLAGQANALGMLPEALKHRLDALDIHRRQNDLTMVGYDLVNTADVLIRLGRPSEADALLAELETGIQQEWEAFTPRARRATTLRLLSAAVNRQSDQIDRHAEALLSAEHPPDLHSQLAALWLRSPVMRPTSTPKPDELRSTPFREFQYWALLTTLERDPRRVMAEAESLLARPEAVVSPEFEWRIGAIAAAAARRLGRGQAATPFRARAADALQRLREAWGADTRAYEMRPDLIDLRRKAGLDDQS